MTTLILKLTPALALRLERAAATVKLTREEAATEVIKAMVAELLKKPALTASSLVGSRPCGRG